MTSTAKGNKETKAETEKPTMEQGTRKSNNKQIKTQKTSKGAKVSSKQSRVSK